MFGWLANAWRVPDLRHRVLFTAGILAVYRFGAWLPAPGINSDQIKTTSTSRARACSAC